MGQTRAPGSKRKAQLEVEASRRGACRVGRTELNLLSKWPAGRSPLTGTLSAVDEHLLFAKHCGGVKE